MPIAARLPGAQHSLPSVPEEEPEESAEPDAPPLAADTGARLSPLRTFSCPVGCMGRSLVSCPELSTACFQVPKEEPSLLQHHSCQTQNTI